MSDEIERLQALALVQTADVLALFALVRRLEASLRPLRPELPDLADLFLELRKKGVQQALENMETQHPGKSARLQALIDQASPYFPPDY